MKTGISRTSHRMKVEGIEKERMEKIMKLTWIGHSCFKVESKEYTIILDPYEDGYVPGLTSMREEADLVLCSHGHGDHNARQNVVLRGEKESPFTITRIETYHDDQKGALRGTNLIHILDDGVCRIAHLGDLGCELEPEQLEQLRDLDAVLAPIGGYYTIDAGQCRKLISQIQPKVVVPMHYRGDGFGFDVIGTVQEYTELCSDTVTYDGSELEITKDMAAQTAILQPKNK